MRVSAAAWVGVCALALVGSAGADGKKNKRLEPAGPLGAPEVFPVTGVGEPSGVAWDARRSRLYVVGDDGTLAEMDAAGQTLATTTVGGNLEDVTVHPPTGFLILLAEIPAALIAWDPDARREVARWPLDTAALLGRAASAKQGFEGLFFHAGGSHPGAGVFYLAHQNAPASVITIAFDPSKPGAPLGSSAVVGRWPDTNATDLTAITYDQRGDRMLVISEARDRLLAFRPDGTAAGEMTLPGTQQEGIAMDGEGRLWVADDRAGTLLRFARVP
jgi:uncharacterized protein YjiK